MLRIGQLRTQQGQLSGVFLPEQGHKAAQKALLQRHQVGKGVEKAHLQIQGGIFVQVPLGGVLLRPEHRADLIHPLKHPHHGLLVELGGLGQHSFPAEIVQPELAGASLGPGLAQLGGVDLGKALLLEKLRKARQMAAWMRNTARARGARRVTGRRESSVSRLTELFLDRGTGGGAAGQESTVHRASASSAPPAPGVRAGVSRRQRRRTPHAPPQDAGDRRTGSAPPGCAG